TLSISWSHYPAAAANVTLRAWPISITGQKPTEGPFSALGYLRVDYQ
ncbi:fimbrial protein, partial [Escherichia coli]